MKFQTDFNYKSALGETVVYTRICICNATWATSILSNSISFKKISAPIARSFS